MSRVVKHRFLWAALVCHANAAHACALCYGATSDSPLAKGMNWGIASLLVVVVSVLASIASFFIFLARRAAAAPPPPMPNDFVPSTNQT